MLAHKGSREGVVVAERIAGQHPHPIKYDNVPSVTYCHPEVASIGLTEEQAKERKLDYQVGRFPFSANGRARSTERDRGVRQDHPGQEVRRDPRGAHRRQPRLGDDPRARRWRGRTSTRSRKSISPSTPTRPSPRRSPRRRSTRWAGSSTSDHGPHPPGRAGDGVRPWRSAWPSVSATVLGVDLLRSTGRRRRPRSSAPPLYLLFFGTLAGLVLGRRRRLAAALAASCRPTAAAGSAS